MVAGAIGFDPRELVGCKVLSVHAIVDSDRDEWLLVLDSVQVVLLSCDPGYDAEGVTRTPHRWETYFADATDTAAGRALGIRRVS
jgi:hypothetical protein